MLAVHGITASSMCWPPVAGALPDDWTMVAPTSAARGAARDLPGAGLGQHAEDVCRAAEQLDPDATGELVLAGHSMGAYVALLAVNARPDLFSRLVIVDGGVPLPVPEGADPDEILAATLGPALERLRHTYADVHEYIDFFKQHPALGPHWSHAVEAYVRYDALVVPEGVRSRAVEEAVRQTGATCSCCTGSSTRRYAELTIPTHLLCAPLGMFGQAPGLLPAAAVQEYAEQVDRLTVETVPDVNHYTILFDPASAARVAEVIVDG